MQGLTVHNEKRVYLKPQLETASITVLHELGHILDKCNGTVSSTPEFKECCTEEKGLIRDYSKNNVSEYFADIYSLSINRMNILTYSREDFPKSIRFIESQPWW